MFHVSVSVSAYPYSEKIKWLENFLHYYKNVLRPHLINLKNDNFMPNWSC